MESTLVKLLANQIIHFTIISGKTENNRYRPRLLIETAPPIVLHKFTSQNQQRTSVWQVWRSLAHPRIILLSEIHSSLLVIENLVEKSFVTS